MHEHPGKAAPAVISRLQSERPPNGVAAARWCVHRQDIMSRESKKRSLSYRVTTSEERAQRETEIERRSAHIVALKARGLNYATIAIRLGLSASTVSRLAREYTQRTRV